MNSAQLWQTFLETGSPEVYLLYSQAKHVEGVHVSYDPRSCITCDELQ